MSLQVSEINSVLVTWELNKLLDKEKGTVEASDIKWRSGEWPESFIYKINGFPYTYKKCFPGPRYSWYYYSLSTDTFIEVLNN